MKKNRLATALIAVTVLSLTAPIALAEDLPLTKETEGKIQFTVDANEQGLLVKPNPEREAEDQHEYIKIVEGNSSAGPLRIQFVPNFDFGLKSGISASAIKASALPLTYARADIPEAGPETTTNYKVAPFVQVTDNRGLSDEEFANNGWNLSVWASEFSTTATASAAAHTLTGARINLKGSTLTTTNGTTADATSLVNGHNRANGVIPTTSSEPLVILASKSNTNGHQVSNVFSDGYRKGTAPGTEVEGVEFVKPNGIAPQKDKEYKAILNWTLTDGL